MCGDAVAERFTRPLSEADRDRVAPRLRKQALRKFRRQSRGDGDLSDDAARAFCMRCAHGVVFTFFDGLALLGHTLDDPVNGVLLVGLGLLDGAGVEKKGHVVLFSCQP